MEKIEITINVANPRKCSASNWEWMLKLVGNFKYLGVIINEVVRIGPDIKQRVPRKAKVNQESTMTVYQLIFIPTLTYSTKSWALTSRHQSRLQLMEMRYLRKAERNTQKSQQKSQAWNVTIRQNLKVFTRMPRLVWEVRVAGKTPRG